MADRPHYILGVDPSSNRIKMLRQTLAGYLYIFDDKLLNYCQIFGKCLSNLPNFGEEFIEFMLKLNIRQLSILFGLSFDQPLLHTH